MSDPPPPEDARCAICQWPVEGAAAREACPACGAAYHADCWAENGGCAIYGCTAVPATEHREAIEITPSWWGQENKPCPHCGGEILAAAVRCRHCGTTFQTARPQEREEFRARAELEKNLPGARRFVIGVFIACLLPCTAFFGAVVALVWSLSHRAELRRLPSLYGVLCRIGIAVGFLQSIAGIGAAILYSSLHSPTP